MRRRKLLLIFFITFCFKMYFECQTNVDIPDDETLTQKSGEVNLYREKNIFPVTSSNTAKDTNNGRLHTLNKACSLLGYTSVNNTINIRAHISPDHKLLYCRVNKCASTMTLEVLRKLFDCDTECLIKTALAVKADTDANKIMNEAFSFMVVREPYGRLFSTYSNIFYFPKEDWLYRGTNIIKLVRENISSDSLKYGHDLTFAELIKYTVEAYEKDHHLDEHVRPMHHKSCNPCMFHFDFIAKLETLQTDFEYILKTLLVKKAISSYPIDILQSLRKWTIYGPLKHLFRTILLVKMSNIQIYNIFLRAWTYYQIIGHVSKNIDFPYKIEDVKNIKIEEFRQRLQTATVKSNYYNSELKTQKSEAMRQAYATVPEDIMERLSKLVRDDCILFGYDRRPAALFDRKLLLNTSTIFNYFKGL